MKYYPSAYRATSKDQTLPYPHYSDPIWDQDYVIYGEQGATDDAVYSDRLWSFNRIAAERAREVTKDMGRTAAMWEAWLSEYFQRPVDVVYIIARVKPDGYAIYYFGFNYAAEATA